MTDDKFENPEPKPGQSKKDFISYCIPYVQDEHKDWEHDKVVAVCYDIWKQHHKNGTFKEFMESQGYELFTDSAQLLPIKEIKMESKDKSGVNLVKWQIRKIVAIVGDKFMAGGFFTTEELKKCYKMWEGTLHDINHEGTSKGIYREPDITKFIGYHRNVTFDDKTNSVSMELHAHSRTKEYQAWEAFVELCEMAGRIPNVSVTYFGKRKFVKTSELPNGADYISEGYKENDLVPVLYNVIPVCVSTVLRGKCSDKGGCGVVSGNTCTSEKCGSQTDSSKTSEETEEQKKLEAEIEQKRQELITWLKKDDNKSED